MTWYSISRELFSAGAWAQALSIAAGGLLLLAGLIAGRIYGARHYSKKNMPEIAGERIREMTTRIQIVEIQSDRLEVENQALKNKLQSITVQATAPIDPEESA